MVKYALYYFAVRGNGEAIRLTFALHGQKFDDIRVKTEDWPTMKSTMPFGKLPMLTIDGTTRLVESLAILRFIGRRFHLAGRNVWEMARVDEMADLCTDVRNAVRPFIYVVAGLESGDPTEMKRTAMQPAVERYFPIYSRLLRENGTGFLVGRRPTIADLQLADLLFTLRSLAPEAFDNHLDLSTYIDLVFTLPRLKTYIAQRPASTI